MRFGSRVSDQDFPGFARPEDRPHVADLACDVVARDFAVTSVGECTLHELSEAKARDRKAGVPYAR